MTASAGSVRRACSSRRRAASRENPDGRRGRAGPPRRRAPRDPDVEDERRGSRVRDVREGPDDAGLLDEEPAAVVARPLEQPDRQIEGEPREHAPDADGVHFLGFARGVRDVGVTQTGLSPGVHSCCRSALPAGRRCRRAPRGAAQEECGTAIAAHAELACVDSVNIVHGVSLRRSRPVRARRVSVADEFENENVCIRARACVRIKRSERCRLSCNGDSRHRSEGICARANRRPAPPRSGRAVDAIDAGVRVVGEIDLARMILAEGRNHARRSSSRSGTARGSRR